MPWQRDCMDVALEIDPATGMLAYREVRVLVPRQSGKTTQVLSLVLHRALGCANVRAPFGPLPQNIVYGAQTGAAAKKKWEDDWLPILDKSRFAKFYKPRKTTGHEALLFANGSMQSLLGSRDDSGHGGTIDLGLKDEAFSDRDARQEQAVVPAMNTREQPQWWVFSTVGTPKRSPYLYGKALSGRQIAERQLVDVEARRGVCYIEYSAPDDADPFDPRVWWDCMPALGYTVTEDAIKASMDMMLADPKQGLNEFRRAYLNQWVLAMGDPIVAIDFWRNLAHPSAARPPWVVFGISVSPEDESAAVVACGEDLLGVQTTVLEHGLGVDWLLPAPEDSEGYDPTGEGDGGPQEAAQGPMRAYPKGRLAELVEEYQPVAVVVNEKECAHLLPELERACGFERIQVVRGSKMPAACAFWLRLVKQSRVWHRDEAELTVALAGAEQRRVLDGGWVWSQAKSGADITPLVAQTLGVSYWLGAWGEEAP